MRSVKSERFAIAKELYPFIKPYKTQLYTLGGLRGYFLMLSLITPIFYKLLIDDVMIKRNIRMLIWVITGYVGIYLLQTLGVVINKRVNNKLYIKLKLKIKTEILMIYSKLKTKDFVKYDVGDLKNRIDNDINIIEKFFNSHCLDYINAIVSVVIIAIIMLYMNWILALFGFAMVPFSFLFTKFMGRKAGKVSNEYRETYGKYEDFLHNSLQNWKEIKTNNLEINEEQIFTKHWDKLSKLFVKNQVYWYINRSFISFKDFFN